MWLSDSFSMLELN